jgi:fatty acid CoA ligase FadD9
VPSNSQLEELAQRVADLYDKDSEFAAAAPDLDICERISQPGKRLADIVRTVAEGYADRPALGRRAVRFIEDSAGRTTPDLLPRFETITYSHLWERVCAAAGALANDPVKPGDRVCSLGFTSVDYTVVDLASVLLEAVSVPLQTSASLAQLKSIVEETQPAIIATSAEYLPIVVELVQSGFAPDRVIVFDCYPEVDEHRDAVNSAKARLADAETPVVVETLGDVIERGKSCTVPQIASGTDDPLRLVIYTSGSTGTPKGAMQNESLVAMAWLSSARVALQYGGGIPSITLNFLPMSHVGGRGMLYAALGVGGTAYFAGRGDLSTLLDDITLVRPTQLSFVPRVWDMLFQEFQREVERRCAAGGDRPEIEDEVKAHLRRDVLGGRYVAALTGSAPISPDLHAWAESLLDSPLMDALGSTESGSLVVDGRVQRPPVIDYKLIDVPELGYFSTDKPYPRGELAVKSEAMFAGYYKQPELTAEVFDPDGYYRSGDIVAEVDTDQLVYIDRRNNVLKLSQGEFVTVSKVEAVFLDSPLIQQIFIYGNSARPYLLAVVVPSEEALTSDDAVALKPKIRQSFNDVARASGLQSYEVPRDFIVETEQFTLENGLLSGIRKPARPKLLERYGDRLEQLYTELAEGQADELKALRRAGADRPVLETVSRAAVALLGAAEADLTPDAHFTDLGGDSVSALTFSNLLNEIFDLDVPVGTIVSPVTDLQGIADYIEAARRPGAKRPTVASVHGSANPVEIRSSELTLDKFVDEKTLREAPGLPRVSAEPHTVLLTGATGFLGRFQALEWLERLAPSGGSLICLVRAKDDAAARIRLDAVFDSGDEKLLAHYRELAADRLTVFAGDKGEPDLGLDRDTWQRLAETVDAIVDPAAMVNHVLPYSQLFGPNVAGTAELIRLALSHQLKPYTYVSTLGVGMGVDPGAFTEDADIRAASPTRELNDGYANGYANSKWAAEVLLREAHDLCGLPVTVFRSDMIMADTRYEGQLNVPDTFTRLILSLAATGIAPESFYQLDSSGNRQATHYDGLPVDFIAEAITTIGQQAEGFHTYHVSNPYEDGLGLDEYVDWLIEAGNLISRISDYSEWYERFKIAVRGLPEKQRQYSVLPLLHAYQQPQPPSNGSLAPVDRFRSAVQQAGIGPDKDIPHVTPSIIVKYITGLQLLGLL